MVNFIIGTLLGGFLIGIIIFIPIMVRIITHITEITTLVRNIYTNQSRLERMVQATMNASEGFVDALRAAATEAPQQLGHTAFITMFKTKDGKHSAASFDQLLKKMKHDPEYQQMTDRDIEELKQLFESNISEDEEDTTNDSDDTDTSDNWKDK